MTTCSEGRKGFFCSLLGIFTLYWFDIKMEVFIEINYFSLRESEYGSRPVTGRHMRCAKKEPLDMTTCKPGLPVSERTLRVLGLRRTSPTFLESSVAK